MAWNPVSKNPDKPGIYYILSPMESGNLMASVGAYENGKWMDQLLLLYDSVEQTSKRSNPKYWMEVPEIPIGEKWELYWEL